MMASDSDRHEYQEEAGSTTNARTSELRLWPRPTLQAYCPDHFLMECKIYHEQENERYRKLVSHSRDVFLAKQGKQAPVPARRQPSRRAKEKYSIAEAAKTTTRTTRANPSSAPFKPARLEKAFAKSQEGAMIRALSALHQKLGLDERWEEYRALLEGRIQATVERLRRGVKGEEGTPASASAHAWCIFSGPLGLRCRYCGFAATARADGDHEDETIPRRILASPAAMHMIDPRKFCDSKRDEDDGAAVRFRGIDFFVDVCHGTAVSGPLIVLASLKGTLDLCAELFGEGGENGEEAILESTATRTARLIALKPNDTAAAFHNDNDNNKNNNRSRTEEPDSAW